MFTQASNYLVIILAYMIGSIPFGFILSKFLNNLDPRLYGSKNIGATNVVRISGLRIGFLTLLLDVSKAFLIIKLIEVFNVELKTYASFFVFIGHIFPIWLKFKGGKGVAVFLGILLSFSVILTSVFVVTWIMIFILFRYSSLSALISSVSTIVVSYYFHDFSITLFILVLNIVIFIRHHENIKGLIKGKEKKFFFKK